MLFIKRQADWVKAVGLLLYYAIDRSAATAAAAVVAATTVVAAAIVTAATAAAAQEDQYDNDDPRATSAKTVTHDWTPPFVYSTEYESGGNVWWSKQNFKNFLNLGVPISIIEK